MRDIDNTDKVKAMIQAALLKGLEECGLTAEKYAKKAVSADTGRLRNSITHNLAPEEKAGTYHVYCVCQMFKSKQMGNLYAEL